MRSEAFAVVLLVLVVGLVTLGRADPSAPLSLTTGPVLWLS